jgi:methyl-accepting chemotaxis protein
MLNGENALQDFMEAVREDAQARANEFARLNEQLEERNRLLEQQLGHRINGAKWFSLLAVVAAVVIGVWVYTLVLHLGQDVNGMSQQMGQMHGYMKNMAAGEPVEGGDSYISSMAHDIHRMSEDMAGVRVEIQQVSSDIGVMRTAMTDMRGDIGIMNTSMDDMRGDMKHMRENIGGMAQSLSRMSRNVGRLSRDAQNLREPFRGMMPW